MKHGAKIRKFGRETDERKALVRSLTRALLLEGKIRTTEARAKEIRPFVEKLITKGKQGTIAARRLVISRLGGVSGVDGQVIDIAKRYKEREGGYTRITKLPARLGDASKMAIIEFV